MVKLLLSPEDYELFTGRDFHEDYADKAELRRCAYCGKRRPSTVDRIVPKSRGGSNSPDNLVYCCVGCNSKKGARTPEEAGMPIIYADESKVNR